MIRMENRATRRRRPLWRWIRSTRLAKSAWEQVAADSLGLALVWRSLWHSRLLGEPVACAQGSVASTYFGGGGGGGLESSWGFGSPDLFGYEIDLIRLTVHDVQMEQVRPGSHHRSALLAHRRKVGGQDGRGHQRQPGRVGEQVGHDALYAGLLLQHAHPSRLSLLVGHLH